MRREVPKQKRKKPAEISSLVLKSKITRSFARQIDEFIQRYRPVLEALAKK